MKFAKRILFGAMAAFALAGCSEEKLGPDDPNRGVGPESDDGVYLSVNIQMPTTDKSRSYTDDPNHSNSGIEVGKDYENNVNTVYLVLAKTDNTFIAWGEIPGNKIVSGTSSTNEILYNTVAKLSKTDLALYYDGIDENNEDDAARKVNVFVFCNPTLNLRNVLTKQEAKTKKDNSWVDEAAEYDATDPTAEIIWSENDFLMSNIAIATRVLPKTIDEWNAYTLETNPFKLSDKNSEVEIDNSIEQSRGAVKVERTAARFDYKDGSPDFTDKDDTNLYQVIFDEWTTEAGDTEKDSYINIKLTKMSFVNMAKKFYYLRRVTDKDTPLDINNTILCGAELPWFSYVDNHLTLNKDGNYVVSPMAKEMLEPITTGFSTYYNYPCFNESKEIDEFVFENWYTSVIDDVIKGPNDNYANKEYHIWRYSTENSIPDVQMQKNGQTTGVVFKGKLIATAFATEHGDKNLQELANIINDKAEKPLTGDPNNDPTLYLFAGRLYATWQNVEQAAKEAAIVPVWEADNHNPDGGYWRLEINRGNTLFHAVFGDGGCGSYTFKDSNGTEYTIDDPVAESPTCPNALWHAWDNDRDANGDRPGFDAESTKAFKNAATANQFTLYQTSIDGTDGVGYYCYYYYWNRHNDNGQNGVMGPMEFCVVRNNVYKLSVTALNRLGHPRHSINDPNPPTPETDDEIDDVYISVEVEVLPWVVRLNNIEF